MDKLLLLFLIKLLYLNVYGNELAETQDIWEINFDGYLFSDQNCQAVLVSLRTFLSDAECVSRALNVSDTQITINYKHVNKIYTNVTSVQKKKIFSFEDIEKRFAEVIIKRNIVVLISNQIVVSTSLDASKLSPAALVLSIENHRWYTQDNLTAEVAEINDEVNFSRCYIPVSNVTKIDVSPCKVSNDSIVCSYDRKISDKKLKFKHFVFCEKKRKEEKKLLIGLLLERTLTDLRELNDQEIPKNFHVESLIPLENDGIFDKLKFKKLIDDLETKTTMNFNLI